jgi:hypothetical protein
MCEVRFVVSFKCTPKRIILTIFDNLKRITRATDWILTTGVHAGGWERFRQGCRSIPEGTATVELSGNVQFGLHVWAWIGSSKGPPSCQALLWSSAGHWTCRYAACHICIDRSLLAAKIRRKLYCKYLDLSHNALKSLGCMNYRP